MTTATPGRERRPVRKRLTVVGADARVATMAPTPHPGTSRPAIAAHYWSIHHLELEDACARVAELGYEGLDLAVGDTGTGERLDLERLATDASERARVADAGRVHRVRFTDIVVGAILVPGSGAEQRATQRELIRALAMNAAELGLTGMTVIPGLVGDLPFPDAERLVRDELRRMVAATSGTGVTISIEPHLESVTDTPERTARMLDAVPGLALTLDYSHFVHSGFGPDEIEPLHSRTRHLHIRQAAPGRLAAPVSAGTIDHRRLLGKLSADGYAGALTTEYVTSDWHDQSAVDAEAENESMRRELVALVDEMWGAQ